MNYEALSNEQLSKKISDLLSKLNIAYASNNQVLIDSLYTHIDNIQAIIQERSFLDLYNKIEKQEDKVFDSEKGFSKQNEQTENTNNKHESEGQSIRKSNKPQFIKQFKERTPK